MELYLHVSAEKYEAETHDRTRNGRTLGKCMDVELHLTGVEPLAHLVIHLAAFEMSLKRPVVPTPHSRSTPVIVDDSVDDTSDPYSEIEAQPIEPAFKQHVTTGRETVRPAGAPDDGRIGEFIIPYQATGDLPASVGKRRARRLCRQGLPVVINVPFGFLRARKPLSRIEIERPMLQFGIKSLESSLNAFISSHMREFSG